MTHTYATDTYEDYTDACAAFNMSVGYAVPADHYVDQVYIGMAGSATNSGTIFQLWIDNSWTGTNSGTYYMMRMSHQGAATPPAAFIQFQDANEVEYLFYFAGGTIHYIHGGAVSGDQDKKINVSVNGTSYFIPLYTT